MHHKSTIALVALAVILTGVVLWDRDNIGTVEADQRTENIIEVWRPDDLSKIEFTVGTRSLQLVKKRDDEGQLDWVLFEGDKRLDGDPLEMTDLAASLELAMFYRQVEDLDEGQLGLGTPRATYAVHMGKLSYTLRIGGDAPSPKGGAYVQVQGGTRGRVSYVITRPTLEEFLTDPSELLNKRLASLMSPSVQSYKVSSGAGTYELRRGKWGGWTSGAFTLRQDGAPLVRASRYQLDLLFSFIGRIQAKRFVPITSKDPDDPVSIVITPIEPGEPTVRLVVGTRADANCREGEAYAIRREPNPLAGCIPANVLEALRVSPAELRDRRVVGTAKGAITELKLEQGDTIVDLARKGGGWHMRRPTEGVAEPEPTDQLVDALIRAEGDRIENPDLAALGLDDPRATVTVLGLPERTGDADHNERVEKIAVGAEIDGVIHVRRQDDGAVLALSADVGALFLPRPTLLRSTQIFDEDRKYIRGLDLDCGGRRQVLKRGLDVAWSFVEPKGTEAAADGAIALTLTDGLRSLKAVRWVAEKPSARHELDKPWCRVTMTLVEPDEADPTGDTKITKRLSVSLGAETRGGYFATRRDDGAVFVAPRALGNAANLWFLSRAALMPVLKDVATITLRMADRTLVVRKQGESWKADGGSNSLATNVKNVLEQLTAEVVEHRGRARDNAGFDMPLVTIVIAMRDKPDAQLTFLVGGSDNWRNTPVLRMRRSDINLTFLVSKARLQPLLDAL